MVLVISLQILNIGLFAQDFYVANSTQNVINSVTEYIAEVVLNKVDFSPEHQQHHSHKHHKHSHSLLQKVQQYVLYKHTPAITFFMLKEPNCENKYAVENNTRLQKVCFDITPPPPKA